MNMRSFERLETEPGAIGIAKRASERVHILAAAIEELVLAMELMDARILKLEEKSDSGSTRDQGSAN